MTRQLLDLFRHDLLDLFSNDLIAFIASSAILVAYHVFLRYKLKRDPAYTVHGVNSLARAAWVENVMLSKTNKDILAVQTLRNAIMGPTFLASTAALLIVGTLTLSGQGDKLTETWHALNVFGSKHTELWQAKVLLMMLNFMIAFFSFSMAIRLFIHVGFMINVPVSPAHHPVSPKNVAIYLNRAGAYHSVGMRAYYFSVPLVFWLFGPHFMLLATIVLIGVLFSIDRAPRSLAEDYKDAVIARPDNTTPDRKPHKE
jgi:uncharacterized membrane protein